MNADNAYVAVVNKKLRYLKKKLEKITKAETQLASGKVLDDEQVALLQSKTFYERSWADFSSIKSQLEEVAQTETSPVTEQVETPVAEEPIVEEPKEIIIEEIIETPVVIETTIVVPQVDLQEELEKAVKKVIRALHVHERYTAITSKPLPEAIDYFGKTILGQTSLSAFQDTLGHSLRIALSFLNDPQNEVVRGVTYQELDNWIVQLADEMDKLHVRGGSLGALLRNAVAPAASTAAPASVPEPTPEFDIGIKFGSLESSGNGLSNVTVESLMLGIHEVNIHDMAIANEAVSSEPILPDSIEIVPSSSSVPVVPEEPVVEETIPSAEGETEGAPSNEKKPRQQRRQRKETTAAPANGEEANNRKKFVRKDKKERRPNNKNKSEESTTDAPSSSSEAPETAAPVPAGPPSSFASALRAGLPVETPAPKTLPVERKSDAQTGEAQKEGKHLPRAPRSAKPDRPRYEKNTEKATDNEGFHRTKREFKQYRPHPKSEGSHNAPVSRPPVKSEGH